PSPFAQVRSPASNSSARDVMTLASPSGYLPRDRARQADPAASAATAAIVPWNPYNQRVPGSSSSCGFLDFSLPTRPGPPAALLPMLGEQLRKAREAAGLTQEEVSFRAGVHRTYVSMLERDKKSPTIDVLFRLCDAIGVTASELIRRVEDARAAGR